MPTVALGVRLGGVPGFGACQILCRDHGFTDRAGFILSNSLKRQQFVAHFLVSCKSGGSLFFVLINIGKEGRSVLNVVFTNTDRLGARRFTQHQSGNRHYRSPSARIGPSPALSRVSQGLGTTEDSHAERRPRPASCRGNGGLKTREARLSNRGTIGVKPKGAGICTRSRRCG